MSQEVFDFLSVNRPFYMATVDGETPKVRPMGFVMFYEGKIWFGMGTYKNVYKQLQANPQVEISATGPNNEDWIRISGRAVFDQRPQLFKAALEAMPRLKDIYPEGGAKMAIFSLVPGQASFMSIGGTPTKIIDW
ncbi:MAG: pyridoxamine 5'-phosphate oxidase family protein [Deltaproteobacteria bacterium]|nr:pyridoxamine 5'-phosphate oxidase family protein [Deltaproteobacteria bacterium]